MFCPETLETKSAPEGVRKGNTMETIEKVELSEQIDDLTILKKTARDAGDMKEALRLGKQIDRLEGLLFAEAKAEIREESKAQTEALRRFSKDFSAARKTLSTMANTGKGGSLHAAWKCISGLNDFTDMLLGSRELLPHLNNAISRLQAARDFFVEFSATAERDLETARMTDAA